MTDNYLELPSNFIHNEIDKDLKSGRYQSIQTRFPPEPNGYLHIGHAKAICISFGTAGKYGGNCYLRFDDTNPVAEDPEFVNSIREDIEWLGFKWKDIRYASGYFDQLYAWAVQLIKNGKAYVCDMDAEQMREYRGTLKEPGKNSPFRDRSIEENLELFEKMKNGELEEGSCVLRAKIDMSSPNINMRDPAIYRILKKDHHQTGDKWKIYPLYDFAHGLSDAIEGTTHSLCSLEFQDHRPLYDWFLEALELEHRPRQIEFSKLNLNYIALSKRRLRQLVEENYVDGWDDPRMPTLRGFRRRGFTPESIRTLCVQAGIAKKESIIDMTIFEDTLRNDLNEKAQRAMCVLDPIKVIIENYPEGKTENLTAPNHPQKEEMGTRTLPFSREIYIDREDFLENPPPPKKFFRLGPEREVRLRYSYIIKCTSYEKDENGKVTLIRATYDENTLGKAPEGRKVKGIIHWVDANSAEDCEVRLYDRLFKVANPLADKSVDFKEHLNPDSLSVIENAKIEPTSGLGDATHFQFERLGYFCIDEKEPSAGKKVYNRAVTLRDGWAKKVEK